MIYQATLRRELHRSLGFEWQAVDPATAMAEVAGVNRETISVWSRRSSQLRKWATAHRAVAEGPLTAAQLAAAQKATRPAKPEELAWATLQAQWRADARGLHLSRAGYDAACAARRADALLICDTVEMADACNQRLHAHRRWEVLSATATTADCRPTSPTLRSRSFELLVTLHPFAVQRRPYLGGQSDEQASDDLRPEQRLLSGSQDN